MYMREGSKEGINGGRKGQGRNGRRYAVRDWRRQKRCGLIRMYFFLSVIRARKRLSFLEVVTLCPQDTNRSNAALGLTVDHSVSLTVDHSVSYVKSLFGRNCATMRSGILIFSITMQIEYWITITATSTLQYRRGVSRNLISGDNAYVVRSERKK